MSFGAVAAIGGAVIGAVASNDASRRASNTQKDAMAQQKEVADAQLQFSRDQWDRYLTTYGPAEDRSLAEANNVDSEANKNRAAQDAAGAVTSSYANLRQRLNETPGLDPSSQQYLNTVSKLGLSEAAQSAAAQTGARNQLDAQGRAARTDALSLGKGLPANAAATMANAGSAYGALGQTAALQGAQAAQGGAAVGRMAGDLLSNPTVINGVKGWFGGGMDTGAGSVTGGYVAPDTGVTYNNPSAYVAGGS